MNPTSDAPRHMLMVVHQATSSTGRIGRQLRARGYLEDVRCPNAGEPLPAVLDGYAGVVVFGGPMSANDDDLPGIRAELDWIPSVLRAGIPFLGVCLGAQLLARVLGARVWPHPRGCAEIGFHPVHPTTAGAGLFDGPLMAYQWHREGFDLPAGTELVAEAQLFENQAFRHGRRDYALQFHPEVTRDIMQRWLKGGAARLTMPGAQLPEAQRAASLRHDADMERWLARFLDHWVAV